MDADLLLHNGIVRGPHARRGHTAIAVRDGIIIAVGTDQELKNLVGTGTETLDLQGRPVLPGFQDAHVHPPQGGLERMRCDLAGVRTREKYLSLISTFAKATKDPWILGGGWAMEAFPGGCPTAATLDTVVPDRPVYLPNRDRHSAWVNSRALQLADITKDTPDPADGRIERLPDGSPSGTLHEGAMALVEHLVPLATPEQRREGLLIAQEYLHSLGITAWQDAWVTPDDFDTYADLATSGELTARVVGAMWWERSRGLEQVQELIAGRSEGPIGRFSPTSVKIMLDGVCETFTASMLAPYLDKHGKPTENSGISFIPRDELSAIVTALDAADFQVHMHALGDRSVRDALHAVGAAILANGVRDGRHQIAHLQVVHPEDIARFGLLDVTANAQALWACAEPQMVELTLPFLGEARSAWQYPFASIARTGGRIALGSDWPVSSPDPLEIMHVAVHRTEPSNPKAEPFLPDERLSLADAVYAYTMGSAHANHLDGVSGSIEVGKYADLIVLDRDIFAPDAGPLAEAQVDHTIIEGDPVYERL